MGFGVELWQITGSFSALSYASSLIKTLEITWMYFSLPKDLGCWKVPDKNLFVVTTSSHIVTTSNHSCVCRVSVIHVCTRGTLSLLLTHAQTCNGVCRTCLRINESKCNSCNGVCRTCLRINESKCNSCKMI